jgi:hypothetical protein
MLHQFGESDVHLSAPAIIALVHNASYLKVPLYIFYRTLFLHPFRVDFIYTRINIICLLALSSGNRILRLTRWPQRYLLCAAQTLLPDLHSQGIIHGCPTKPPPSMRPVSKGQFQLCAESLSHLIKVDFTMKQASSPSACCARARERDRTLDLQQVQTLQVGIYFSSFFFIFNIALRTRRQPI